MVHAAVSTSPSQQAPQVCVALMRLARFSGRRFARALADGGLSGPAFALLDRLEQEGPASQLELARSLGVHPSNVVRLLDDLEDACLLARRRDRADRRRQVVELTAAGRRRLAKARALARRIEAELLEGLSGAERRQLEDLLCRLSRRANSCG